MKYDFFASLDPVITLAPGALPHTGSGKFLLAIQTLVKDGQAQEAITLCWCFLMSTYTRKASSW